MSYLNGVWNDLKFNAGSAALQLGSGIGFRYRKDSGLIYKNTRYKSVHVEVAKHLVSSQLKRELDRMLPRFIDRHSMKRLEDAKKKRKDRYVEADGSSVMILKNNEIQSREWGQIKTAEGKVVTAQDRYGDRVREALILSFNDDVEHIVEDVTLKADGTEDKNGTAPYKTKTVWHIDLAPKVSMSSRKNVVMTQVQGRDFSRKELVSGGDMAFSIQGTIVSNEDGVYPETEVKKFLKIMQYNGILDISFMSLGAFGIKRVIVTDYSLGAVEYKNEQPYSFSCVAVEPDEEIQIVKDTIQSIDYQLAESPMNKWYKMILSNKWASMAAKTGARITSNTVSGAVDFGIDKLVPNI